MIEKTKSYETIKNFIIYFVGNFSVKAIGFFSIPIFTRMLNVDDYGIVNVFRSYIAVFATIFSLSIPSVITRFYFDDEKRFPEFNYLAVEIIILLLIFPFLGIFLFSSQISQLLNIDSCLVYLLFVCVVFEIIITIFSSIYIPQKKAKLVSFSTSLMSYFSFFLSILLVFLMKDNKYFGRIYGQLFAYGAFSIYFVFKIKAFLRKPIGFNIQNFKYIFHFALPVVLVTLSQKLLNDIDRFIINSTIGPGEAGLYSFAYNIGMLAFIIISALESAWYPQFFEYVKNKNFKKLNDSLKDIMSFMLIFILFVIYFGYELAFLLAPKNYITAVVAIPAIAIGYYFFGLFRLLAIIINYSKKMYYNTFMIGIGAVVNVILNFIYIPKYGYLAAAYTTLFSYFIMFALYLVIDRFFLKLNFYTFDNVFINITVFSVSIMLFAVYNYYLNDNYVVFFFLKSVTLVVIFILIFIKHIIKVFKTFRYKFGVKE